MNSDSHQRHLPDTWLAVRIVPSSHEPSQPSTIRHDCSNTHYRTEKWGRHRVEVHFPKIKELASSQIGMRMQNPNIHLHTALPGAVHLLEESMLNQPTTPRGVACLFHCNSILNLSICLSTPGVLRALVIASPSFLQLTHVTVPFWFCGSSMQKGVKTVTHHLPPGALFSGPVGQEATTND